MASPLRAALDAAALAAAEFAGLLAEALHPRHGTLIVNMHNKDPGRPILLPGFILRRSAPPRDLGYDPQSPTGQRIVSVAATFAAALGRQQPEEEGLPEAEAPGGAAACSDSSTAAGGGGGVAGSGLAQPSSSGSPALPVRAFTVSVAKQLNVEVVVARGLGLDEERGPAALQLQAVGAHVAGLAGYRFPAGKRACRGFCEV
jgi:hypothetical protein